MLTTYASFLKEFVSMRVIDPSRREQIVDTAARLFGQGRYHEVRMEDIAQAAGVAKGTLYRYFDDKEDLYLGLILTASNRLFQEVDREIKKTADGEQQVSIYVEATIRFFARFPYFLELVQRIETGAAPQRLAALKESRDRFFRLIEGIVQALIDSGKYATSRPDLAALALSGMTRQIMRFHAQPFNAEMGQWIVQQFLHGLRPVEARAHAARRAAK